MFLVGKKLAPVSAPVSAPVPATVSVPPSIVDAVMTYAPDSKFIESQDIKYYVNFIIEFVGK